MSDTREKLVKLLKSNPYANTPYSIADHLIANGVTVQQWIPVEEEQPADGDVVLVYGKRGGIYTAEFYRRGEYYWFHKLNSKNHHCEPTHWMPLPRPPKEVR